MKKIYLLIANHYANLYGEEINQHGCTAKAKLYNKRRTYFYDKVMKLTHGC